MSRTISTRITDRNQDASVYMGNLEDEVDEEILYELALQVGPVVSVHLPKDRVSMTHQGYGFVEFKSERDAEYAAQVLNTIRLFGKPLRVNRASQDKVKNIDIGAELFVGSLDPMVDEKVLYDTFSVFGTIVGEPKVARDEKGVSRGFGFVGFDSFEASDRALEAMNNQYLMNRPCHVSYAFKKDGKGERHGDEAERLLASQAQQHNYTRTASQSIAAGTSNAPPTAPAFASGANSIPASRFSSATPGLPKAPSGVREGGPPPPPGF